MADGVVPTATVPIRAPSAVGLAVSPDGSAVYVTGTSIASYNTPADYATVAYRATSGAQLWSARYPVTGAQDNAAGVVVSGGNAIVTGTSGPYGSQSYFAAVAYQGLTGPASRSHARPPRGRSPAPARLRPRDFSRGALASAGGAPPGQLLSQ